MPLYLVPGNSCQEPNTTCACYRDLSYRRSRMGPQSQHKAFGRQYIINGVSILYACHLHRCPRHPWPIVLGYLYLLFSPNLGSPFTINRLACQSVIGTIAMNWRFLLGLRRLLPDLSGWAGGCEFNFVACETDLDTCVPVTSIVPLLKRFLLS